MSDVFPRRNLPPGAEQWGRAVENRVSSAERALEVANQSLSGQNRNTASSLAMLGGAVSEVSQWRSYVAKEPEYNVVVNAADEGLVLPWRGEVASEVWFDIQSERSVKVEFSAYFTASATHNGAEPYVSPEVNMRLHFIWAGQFLTYYSPFQRWVPFEAGSTTGFSDAQRTSFWDVVTLSPGTYRVGFAPEILALSGSYAQVRIQNPRVHVQVLQPQ